MISRRRKRKERGRGRFVLALKGKDNRREKEGDESSMRAAENKCPVLIKRQVENSDSRNNRERERKGKETKEMDAPVAAYGKQ